MFIFSSFVFQSDAALRSKCVTVPAPNLSGSSILIDRTSADRGREERDRERRVGGRVVHGWTFTWNHMQQGARLFATRGARVKIDAQCLASRETAAANATAGAMLDCYEQL